MQKVKNVKEVNIPLKRISLSMKSKDSLKSKAKNDHGKARSAAVKQQNHATLGDLMAKFNG